MNNLSFKFLSESLADLPVSVSVFGDVGSTNAELLVAARDNSPEGTLFIAMSQSAGRGTRGRAYFCPPDYGVYFSLLLRPRDLASSYHLITPCAALAVTDAIAEVFGVRSGIKWVNDVFVGGKKVAGILAEADSSAVALGIGANLAPPPGGYPGLPNAGAITSGDLASLPEFAREKLVTATVRSFWDMYQHMDEPDALDEYLTKYRDRSILIGREVTLGDEHARVLGIDGDFRLIVQYSDGKTENISQGEVIL
jgi:BirA family biotin operon repressor/biotin-[acetyl-CoA-carboxylase] ligase